MPESNANSPRDLNLGKTSSQHAPAVSQHAPAVSQHAPAVREGDSRLPFDKRLWPAKGLFVTGTDTDVGKTFVGAIIVRSLTQKGYRVGVYKPVASGCDSVDGKLCSSDASVLWEAAGRPAPLERVCPQLFAAPLAPNLAAAAAGRTVDSALLRTGLACWQGACDLVVVEGAGGLYSPISDGDFVIDLAIEFAYPLIVVAANRLGTINATLQTLLAAQVAGLSVAGVVLSTAQPASHDQSLASNAQELAACLERLGWQIPLLGVVPHGGARVDSWTGGPAGDVAWESLAGLGEPR